MPRALNPFLPLVGPACRSLPAGAGGLSVYHAPAPGLNLSHYPPYHTTCSLNALAPSNEFGHIQ